MRIVDGIARIAEALAGVALVLLMVHVTVDVVSTAVGRPLRGTTEVAAELYMPAIVFGALAMVQRRGEEIRVDILAILLHDRIASLLDRAAQLVVMGSALWLAWHTGLHAHRAWRIGEFIDLGVLRVPAWPGKAMLPLGLGALALAAFTRALRPSHEDDAR
ncbi:MAG: TRAP transporter small permease subunit [Pararhodobacter sp.]|nr:TRAP transporter small permease subunit [Pararhodobacter sp.]